MSVRVRPPASILPYSPLMLCGFFCACRSVASVRIEQEQGIAMTPISIVLILLSALFHALWNYFSKASRSPQLFFFWIGIFTMGVAIVAFAIRVPIIPRTVWIYMIASGLVHLVYWFSLSRAYMSGEISYVYPIARSAPGFLPIFVYFFLGEKLSAQAWG